ncbi:MAG TPA: hypothetical protein VJ385_08765 [Fibrobacteria bacterium]|nr:hypothetical protein [Fibrobacteria bacterium]
MPEKKPSPDRKLLTLLGGSALFGYLGCLPPGSGTGAVPEPAAAADPAVRKDSASIVLKPDPEAQTGPMIVRKGPTLGEPCATPNGMGPLFCTIDGMPLSCFDGVLVKGPGPEVTAAGCAAGDTIPTPSYRHFGFTGIDKAGMRRNRGMALRRAVA